ncbi:hypothetical protein TorRG33x02_241890 [Trema orientale]|uniref:Uncharacterized protein n=1 Tax=Trema orientale TaxID=63057 RepID=A0A2P5DTZ0_TREOI|nr:hypothetical protein TorRG33x02_241890 [Trema orientale]
MAVTIGLNSPTKTVIPKDTILDPQKRSNRRLCPFFVKEEVERRLSSGGGRGRQCAARAVLTLERTRTKIDLLQESLPKINIPVPSLEHGGGGMDGGGGMIGGGSGSAGGGGGGDSDEYRWDDRENGGDESNSGFFRGRSTSVPEVFDRQTMNAVLREWAMTMKDLPLDLQQAYMIGALSSAKLTRFLWLNAQPSFVRLLVRLLPSHLSTAFTSRIMADPSLPYKLCFEALFSLGFSVWLDTRDSTAECIKREWQLAPLARNLLKNSQRQRLQSSFRKAVVFFALGFIAKASAWVISGGQHGKLSIATLSKEALVAGLSLALVSNLRYRIVGEIDRRLQLHFDVPNASLCVCLVLRVLNIAIGTQSLNWVRPEDRLAAFSTRSLLHSLSSLNEDASGVNWFDFKNATGFGVVDTSTKPKRKRDAGHFQFAIDRVRNSMKRSGASPKISHRTLPPSGSLAASFGTEQLVAGIV